MSKGMTYAGVGVNYDAMDPFKRLAQLSGHRTARNIERMRFYEMGLSRGESAYLMETEDAYFAHVEEGLGTKNLVADDMYILTGKSYYGHIAQCTVAMIVNDMITVGALPLSVAMHLAVGSSDWFNDSLRCENLVGGWSKACNLARCVWGGGETPTLKGIVVPGTVVLSGSAMGLIKPKSLLMLPDKVKHGDAIILIESSGIHANGLTLAREIAAKLPDGYLTKLSDGRTYGESLLDPTCIYVPIIDECQRHGINIHYGVNITGHGWRKLMRAPQPLAYVIEFLPRQLPIFDFIQKHGPVNDREAYGNLNMGAGFALYVDERDVERIFSLLKLGLWPGNFSMVLAGHVEKSDVKKVVIKPMGLEYLGETLAVR